jgi:hypothetical protein
MKKMRREYRDGTFTYHLELLGPHQNLELLEVEILLFAEVFE